MNNNIQWKNSVNDIQWDSLMVEEFHAKEQTAAVNDGNLNLQLWRILFLLTLGLCVFNNF
ncbi:hypothetical protein [Mastigocoleus testarum]|uniref:Uncharacterized protein n=1 Tax=Mastigocoleus testarum BC008 TaxID=371196 RepID=A0A0V7ZKC5_9CYAN|nr:hypothetical protein [Mastigocoleus testarum]KST64904.1 hypothetical protein BC008_19025 [Mastigocoleus testarum BC008]KST67015.1 hypothetical protein BC008_27885 [Mastigocoleus testarum BC008]